MFSYSKTPPKKQREDLLLLNGVNKFKRSNKPMITKEDRDILQAKLAVQKQSTIATSQRIINQNNYINFNRNPFSEVKNKNRKFKTSQSLSPNPNRANNPQTRKKKQVLVSSPKFVNIIDEINELKSDQLNQKDKKRMNKFQKIDVLISQSKKISSSIMGRLQKSKREVSPRFEIQNKNSSIQKQIIGMTQQEKERAKNIQIDQIIAMHDSNFFFHEGRQKLNIFKCLQNDQNNLSSIQQLKQHKFSFNSIIMKVGKMELSTERQISSVSRQLVTRNNYTAKQIIDMMSNNQLTIKQKQLNYSNLISMASGRLSSQVYHYLNHQYAYNNNFNQQASDVSSQQQQQIEQVIFKKNTQSYKQKYRNQNEQRYQITEFANVHLRKNQFQYKEKCKALKDRIGKLLQQKKFSLNNRIQDYKQFMTHDQELKATISSYLNENSDDQKDVSKLVRKQKIFKDRTDVFKLKYLVDSLKFKNQLDSKIKSGFQTSRF